MPKMKFLSLRCLKTEDNLGGDEAYITMNGQQNVVWGPMTINDGQTASLTNIAPIQFSGSPSFQLWDQDTGFLDPDDLLGSLTVSDQQAGKGALNAHLTGDGANYILQYEVLADPPPPPSNSSGMPDGKKPLFPIVKDASGARGYARVSVEADGVVTLYMKVDCPANGSTTRYVATTLVAGYKDNASNNILTDKIETHSLTLGSQPFKDSDKDATWILASVKPEDAIKIRHVRVFLERDKSEPDLATQVVTLCRKVGEVWDAAATLYGKVKDSELGQDAAIALTAA
jgi:hypothetical protein